MATARSAAVATTLKTARRSSRTPQHCAQREGAGAGRLAAPPTSARTLYGARAAKTRSSTEMTNSSATALKQGDADGEARQLHGHEECGMRQRERQDLEGVAGVRQD
eukprot:scaffold23048_cov63-Phaeocystis_antarctica.AAC.3